MKIGLFWGSCLIQRSNCVQLKNLLKNETFNAEKRVESSTYALQTLCKTNGKGVTINYGKCI